MTDPKNFRRDAGVPCPVCRVGQHSFESMQIHYANHTEDEKRGAWEALLLDRNKLYNLSEVPKGYQRVKQIFTEFTFE